MRLAVGAAELASVRITPAQPPEPAEPADGCLLGEPSPHGLDRLQVDRSGDYLVGASTGVRFTPWGMRTPGVIPETFWNDDFDRLVEAFRETRRMGSNLVRFNLQFSSFVGPPSPGHPDGTPNKANLARLQDTVDLAEQTGMYIELSGLRIQLDYDNGDWYATRDEAARWRSQAVFWSAIASQLKHSDAVAWFDLMNEPAVPTEVQQTWCRSTLGPRLLRAIPHQGSGRPDQRRDDPRVDDRHAHGDPRDGGGLQRLISVAALPYGNSGFRPQDVTDLEEIAIVHLYPVVGEHDRAGARRREAKPNGQPLILDETGPFGGGDVRGFILGTLRIGGGMGRSLLRTDPCRDPQLRRRRSATTGTSASTGRSCASRRWSTPTRRRRHAALAAVPLEHAVLEPHHVTRPSSSAATCQDIFETPRTRSVNVIGTSAMRPPCCHTRYASSIWKP